MSNIRRLSGFALACVFVLGHVCGAVAAAADTGAGKPPRIDARLRAAEEFVARSDKYLHQSALRRGMTGYGLTVLAGAKIEKFDVTIISVLHNTYPFPPRRDVILCRLSGLNLEKTGVISGMSGSPVYFTDPADGKDKLIGAVAYAWPFQKEAICGVQPISQMLAIEGVDLPARPGAESQPSPADAAGGQAASARVDEAFAGRLLDPAKIDFSAMSLPNRRAGIPAVRSGLAAMTTPVMISGVGAETIELAERMFGGTGLVPLQAGSVGDSQAEALADIRLAPGSAVAIPMVIGDADLAGVGTVTAVMGDRVLAFGHGMFGEGAVEMPMSTAYIHTVIPSITQSFKLGSALKVAGALTRDENTGIYGKIGAKAKMIPMTVTVHWPAGTQKFRYEIIRHRWLTAVLARLMLGDSVSVNRAVPERHTIEYAMDIEFERFGRYRAANISSASKLSDAISDLTRPLVAMMNTPLGEPNFPKSIDLSVTVRPVEMTAKILSVELDRNVYRPGERVGGKVTLRLFRAGRIVKDIWLDLPEDLPDGKYRLLACNAAQASRAIQEEMPHRFKPRTVEQLLKAVKDAVQPRMNAIYVRMPLPDGGLAVRKNELEHLPASMAEILSRAAPMDTSVYTRSEVQVFPTDYVLAGSAGAEFVVRKHPRRTH